MAAPADAAGGHDSGLVAWVTDGDTFRLESGERIRIAGIDAPETHRDQAKCAGEIPLGLRAKDSATSLLAWRAVTFDRVGRSYTSTVATVTVDGSSDEHTSERQSLMRISYAVYCLTKNKHHP